MPRSPFDLAPPGTPQLPTRQPTLTDPDIGGLLRQRVEAALSRLAPGTQRQYDRTLRLFATWAASSPTATRLLGGFPVTSWWAALVQLLRAGPLAAATIVEAYLAEGCRNRAPATIAQRLASIRWAVRLAREAGLIPWELHVRGPKIKAYRNTRGPGLDAFQAVLARVDAVCDGTQHRDGIVLALLFVLGLRRGEIAVLRVGDVDLVGSRLLVQGKGMTEQAPMSLPTALRDRIQAYLDARRRPAPDAPLVVSFSPRKGKENGGGLTASGIYRIVQRLFDQTKIPAQHVTPHGIRHTAITSALDAVNGDIRRVRSFARHSKVETTLVYDDNRRDVGGEVASKLADLVKAGCAPKRSRP